MASPNSPELSQEAFNIAAELLLSHTPPREVERRLIESQGLSQESAVSIIAKLQKAMVPNMELGEAVSSAAPSSTAIAPGAAPAPFPVPSAPAPAPAASIDVSGFSDDPEIQEIYRFAAGLLESGKSSSHVKRKLQDQFGIDHEAAEIVTANVLDVLAASSPYAGLSAAEASQIRQDQGRKLMIRGGFWLVGGLLVTVLSFAAASGGGRFFLAWGAVIYGIVDIIRGAIMMGGNSNN